MYIYLLAESREYGKRKCFRKNARRVKRLAYKPLPRKQEKNESRISAAPSRNREQIRLFSVFILPNFCAKKNPRRAYSRGDFPKDQVSKELILGTFRNRSWVGGAKETVKPAEARVPPAVVPAEATHAECAARAAVDRSPEENELSFTALWNEFSVSKEVIQQVGVVHRPLLELLAKLMALNCLAVLLAFGKVEREICGIPLNLPTLDVPFDFPTAGHKGGGIEIDHVLDFDDFGSAH